MRKNELIQEKIISGQLEILYQNSYISILGNFICSSLIFIGLYEIRQENGMLIWFVSVILVMLFRIFTFYLYRYHIYSDSYYLIFFTIGVIATAILWGTIDSLLMPSGDYLHQMIIIVIIAGITAGSVQSLQANLFICYSYAFITILPLTIWLYLQSGTNYLVLAISMTTYLCFVLLISLRGYSLLMSKLELYYENIELLDELSNSNKQLQNSYESLAISEDRFHAILLHSPVVTAIIDTKGKYIAVNEPLCSYLGYTQEELLTKTFQELTYPEDLNKEMILFDNIITGKLPYFQMDKRHIHKDGHLIWTLVTVIAARSPAGKKQELITQYQDISERKRNEATMEKLNVTLQNTLSKLKIREREEALINKMNEVLQICDSSFEVYPRINLFAKQLFPELNGALAIRKNNNDLMETLEQWGSEQFMKPNFSINDCFGVRSGSVNLLESASDGISCAHYLTIPTGGQMCLPLIVQGKIIGGIYLYSTNGKALSKNQQELALTFVNTIKLTLANLRLRELLKESSIHDPLTGLYNRRYVDESMPHELQRVLRNRNKLFVIMFDIDFFKKFNDHFGHYAGDEVLKYIGNVFQKKFRGSDIACRYGGEEFLIYLSNDNVEDVVARIQQIRNDIKRAVIIYNNMQLPPVTVSVGLAYAPDHGITVNELILAADQALYRAKESGRDKIEIYNS